jgi:hypothetical protein
MNLSTPLMPQQTACLPLKPQILQHLADPIANKQQQPYSAIMKHLRLRIAITLVKAVHHCIQGSKSDTSNPAPDSSPKNPIEPSPEYLMLYSY